MWTIDKIYVNGKFVTPHGKELFQLIPSSTKQKIGQVRLGDEEDIRMAIESAKAAFEKFSRTTKLRNANELSTGYIAELQLLKDLGVAAG